MLVDLAVLYWARPAGNSSERNQTKEDELGISSGPLTLGVPERHMTARPCFSSVFSCLRWVLTRDGLFFTSVLPSSEEKYIQTQVVSECVTFPANTEDVPSHHVRFLVPKKCIKLTSVHFLFCVVEK